MKALEFMRELDGPDFETPGTVDNFKFGDREREVKRVVTCLTATPDVIKESIRLGADLIITHEPTFYTHVDEDRTPSPVMEKKIAAVEEAGIPICRYHDHMHFSAIDMISAGFLDAVGWEGEFDGEKEFTLDEPMTPLEIAKDIEKKCGIKHCRIVGKRDGKVRRVSLFLGHRGGDWWGNFQTGMTDSNVAIGGEWCEWANGEMIRDASQFGMQLTAIMLGHAASERDGMKWLAKQINSRFADRGITAEYVDCGELFTYTDD